MLVSIYHKDKNYFELHFGAKKSRFCHYISSIVAQQYYIIHTWVKDFRIISEFRISRLTFHRKSASKS